jgi:hypothetical protein
VSAQGRDLTWVWGAILYGGCPVGGLSWVGICPVLVSVLCVGHPGDIKWVSSYVGVCPGWVFHMGDFWIEAVLVGALSGWESVP